MDYSSAIEIITQTIKTNPIKAISFERFMTLALYSPDYGYYAKEKKKIGKEGDFYTSSTVHNVFGETLADYIWDRLGKIEGRNKYIVEMGGGDGTLSEQVIKRLMDMKDVSFEGFSYVLIEASAYHRQLQWKRLSPYGSLIPIRIFPSIEEARKELPSIQGVFFSNELPDAFPVHLVCFDKGDWREIFVTLDEKGDLYEIALPVSQEILNYCEGEKIPKTEGYRTEVNLNSLKWVDEVTSWIQSGIMITIDYGYSREELYASYRNRGTLMCYRDHQAIENPYQAIGDQDMTTHVNFSIIKEKGEEKGFETLYFLNQGQFLVQAGILKRLEEHTATDPFRNQASRRNRAIRQLIMEEGMGRVFKVLVQEKK